ncbi:FAD-dependent oxidoreductase [Mesorhizobium tianshanense]|uniref:4-methylaminobutanoate oxidase (Formaldehyde-forming) n=1 Tax=Mesorhizobium tianshanense TaxID=39844 RepID=A0A562NLT0_9HYPH|nr:FAD-dependent oxidoreductase [Mesorhizobium tianshanense]TWI33169.1 4-methylaminobutanoate oxidase (formaldehyde-forming) [Mesorhizobium tianshanense]GLS34959.1 FAD-dependent oxidoreductase [Mesorhizobium tianshanense]
MTVFPSQAEIVVIGGGVLGTSIAFHLAKAGAKDVILLEKNELTHGSTWHAAGMVGQLRSSRNLSRLLQTSVNIYEGLEAETGLASGWRRTGSLRLASTPERLLEAKRSNTIAKSVGLEAAIITPKEIADLFPIAETKDVLGALFVPGDGVADPTSLTLSFAAGARKHGVKIFQHVAVNGFERSGRRINAVRTTEGDVRCRIVVNAAGVWAREIGKLMQVNLACCGLVHQYLITQPIDGMDSNMPSMRDPDLSVYYKPESNGLVVGCWEPNTAAFDANPIPGAFGRELLPPAMDRFEPFIEAAIKRTPLLAELGIRDVITGPIPFSADGDFVMGPIPGLENTFVASGCVVGIAAGGGIGKVMAEWILEGQPSMDLWPVDARRFGDHHGAKSYLFPRAIEVYGDHYRLQPPGHETSSSRGFRRSPLYSLLKQKQAVYGAKFGWERPNWFASGVGEAVERPSFDRPNWFSPVADEHNAVRNAAGIFDLTSFAKYEIHGPDAFNVLQFLSVRNLDKSIGAVSYTQLCNKRGGIEADVSITRLSHNRFYYVTGTGNGVRDVEWIRANAPANAQFAIEDVTSAWSVLLVTGPKARGIIADAIEEGEGGIRSGSELSTLTIGAAHVRALPISFAGEVGWELHVPSEFACDVYERLLEAGGPRGLRNVGYRALDSLRIEKGYRYWGSDITPDYNPYEAGLGFCVDLDRDPFLSQVALRDAKLRGPSRRLCTFVSDKLRNAFGGEALYVDGEIAGATTSAAFAHSIGKVVVNAYVPSSLVKNGEFEIECFGERSQLMRATQRDLLKSV